MKRMPDWLATPVRFIRRIALFRVPLYAANASFYLVLSVFPAILLVLALLPHGMLSTVPSDQAVPVDICMQDIDFYEESNGGVTISGGEGMAQPEFLEKLVLALKEKNLHVAIETTGYIQKEIFQKLAPLFDLLLFEIHLL